jgi:hypothetical protein
LVLGAFVRGRWPAGVLIGLLVLSGLLVLPGCVTKVTGTAEPAASPTAKGTCQPGDLMRCIVAAPTGAAAYPTSLGPNGAVATRQFLAAFYPEDPRNDNQIADELRTEGLRSIAHRDWAVTQGDQVDIVLLGFATATGARQRAEHVADSTRHDPTLRTFEGSGMPGGVVAFVDRTVDKNGNVGVRAYAAFGQVELEFNYFHPATLDAADLTAQIGREVTLLRGWSVVFRVVGVVAGQERGQPLDGVLEAGVGVDEYAQALGQPAEGHLFVAAPFIELFDAAIGEIHGESVRRAGYANVAGSERIRTGDASCERI